MTRVTFAVYMTGGLLSVSLGGLWYVSVILIVSALLEIVLEWDT